MTARHRPLSRVRYAERHPSITVHFDLDTHVKVMDLRKRSGLSLNQLVRQALGSLESHIDTTLKLGQIQGRSEGRKAGYLEGHKAGYLEGHKAGSLERCEARYLEGQKAGYAGATAIFLVTYRCARCGRPLELRAGARDAIEAAEYLTRSRWAHAECPAGLPDMIPLRRGSDVR
jgi:hypothetical protein